MGFKRLSPCLVCIAFGLIVTFAVPPYVWVQPFSPFNIVNYISLAVMISVTALYWRGEIKNR